jgi:hypothetical protein
MSLIVPPQAHLPRTREALDQVANLLDLALEPARRFRKAGTELENDLRIAVALHSLSALDAARAAHLLSGTDFTGMVLAGYRTVCDCLVKIRWMRADPQRARIYLIAEPFERYALASETIRTSDRWPVILANCKSALDENPWILKLDDVQSGSKNKSLYDKIVWALRMPSPKEMASDIGMDDDDYMFDTGISSLVPHTSVVHAKSFTKSLNSDGTVNLSTALDPIILLWFVSRTTVRLGAVANEVLNVCPDGAVAHKAAEVERNVTDAIVALKAYMESLGRPHRVPR